MTTDEAMSMVRQELERAQAAHPAFHSGHEGYAVVREEVDELWDAVKASKTYTHYDEVVGREAIQVAAMAVRFLIDLRERASAQPWHRRLR